MNAGDRLGRWRLLLRVATTDGVERWRAVAEDTGEPGEVLAPLSRDPAVQAAFHDVHQELARVREPGVVKTLEVRRGPQGVHVVRGPIEDLGLESVRGPLDAPTVAWIGATLVPAVLAAGGATRGRLAAGDVGLDARGGPVVAPRGASPARIPAAATRSVAPESFAGTVPDGSAGLYGLGALLYRLATGREPDTAGTRPDRAPPPPPSAMRHGIPPALDAALLRLLSPSPGERAGALPLLQEAAGPPVDLRVHARRAGVVGEVVTTVSADRPRTRDADPDGLVFVPARALAGLEPAARSLAAGLARVPVATLEGLAEAGLPLVLAETRGRAAARDRAAELARASGLPVDHVRGPVLPDLAAAVVAIAVFGVGTLLGLLTLAAGLVPLSVASFAVAAVALSVAFLGARSRESARGVRRDLAAAQARARAELVEASAGGVLDPAWDRLARLRVQVARADLPAAAASDLRGALRDIELRLEGLAQVSGTAERALAEVDPTALRTRLAALDRRAADDSDARAQRDRLARTVADLDALEERRARVAADATRLVDGMGEIAALLGRLGDEVPDDDALAALGRTARHVGAAIAEEDTRPAPRRLAQREEP